MSGMFDSDTHSAATDALFDAVSEPEGAAFTGAEEPADAGTQGETVTPDQPLEAQVPPSREIDLNSLPEEARQYIQAREREMTADYTRKTQEAAQQRQEAEQAIQFIEALNNDPSFARQVYDTLAGVVGEADPYAEETFSEYEDPYNVEAPDDPYYRELQELKSWKEQLEGQMYQAQLEAGIDRQLAEIRSANPSWGDDDINDILGLGFSTAGDLHKAAEAYKAMENRLLSRYTQAKSSVNTPAPLQGGSGTPTPESLEDLRDINDPRLRAMAAEFIANAQSS